MVRRGIFNKTRGQLTVQPRANKCYYFVPLPLPLSSFCALIYCFEKYSLKWCLVQILRSLPNFYIHQMLYQKGNQTEK